MSMTVPSIDGIPLGYQGERHLMYVPQGRARIEVHLYTATEMVELFEGWQLVELNHVGKTSDNQQDGVWIDMIWAALHYEKLAEAAATKAPAVPVPAPFSPSTIEQTGGEMA